MHLHITQSVAHVVMFGGSFCGLQQRLGGTNLLRRDLFTAHGFHEQHGGFSGGLLNDGQRLSVGFLASGPEESPEIGIGEPIGKRAMGNTGQGRCLANRGRLQQGFDGPVPPFIANVVAEQVVSTFHRFGAMIGKVLGANGLLMIVRR